MGSSLILTVCVGNFIKNVSFVRLEGINISQWFLELGRCRRHCLISIEKWILFMYYELFLQFVKISLEKVAVSMDKYNFILQKYMPNPAHKSNTIQHIPDDICCLYRIKEINNINKEKIMEIMMIIIDLLVLCSIKNNLISLHSKFTQLPQLFIGFQSYMTSNVLAIHFM
eukprot:UN05245